MQGISTNSIVLGTGTYGTSGSYLTFNNTLLAGPSFDNIWVDAGAMSATSISGATPSSVTFTGSDNFISDVWDFDDTGPQYVNFKLMMPDYWDLGSVKVKLAYTPSSGGGGIVWGISAGAYTGQQSVGAALGTTYLVSGAVNNTGNLYVTTGANVTVGGSPISGCVINFRIGRIATNANNTSSGHAHLWGADIQFNRTPIINQLW